MKREGKRGEGKFIRISWDEALDTIAEKLAETKREYGPYSILHHPYSTMNACSLPVAPWFGAGFAGWDSHSLNGWQEPMNWVLGREFETCMKRGFDLVQDEANIFKSRLIVLWGYNPGTVLAGAFVYNMLRAKEMGIPIICVEPRYTPSVEILADQWLPIRPTTDVAMIMAMANVWFQEDLCDTEFVAKNVEPEGLQKWKAYVLGSADGIEKTPAWAEAVCGVPAETIAEFARLYARSKPVNLIAAATLGRQFYGENATRAVMYLQALTGNCCIPGGTAAAETWFSASRPTVVRPAVDWQRKPGWYDPPVLICGYKWPKAVDLRTKLDKGEISKEEYNNQIGAAPDSEPVNIQMLMLESNNHMNTLSDINRNIRAVSKIGFTVVFSYFADQESSRYADILIPQISSAFEGTDQMGVRGVPDRFCTAPYLGNYFLYPQKCIEPMGEIKSHDWFWTQIAGRLGLVDYYNPRMKDVTDADWDNRVEDLHREAYEKWAGRENIKPMNPPSWDEFQKRPVFRWEIAEPYYPGKADVEKGINPFRGTESGKIEFYSQKLARGAAYLAANEFYPGKYYGAGNLPAMAQMTFGGKDNFHSKDTESFPLLLSSPHPLYRVHSFLDNQDLLRGDCYRHAVWLSAVDAAARGVKDDDKVRVFNDLAEMVVPAYVTDRVVPGTVYLFHGGWYRPGLEKSDRMPAGIDYGGAPNLLTHNEDVPATIVGFFPTKSLVEIEKWEGA